MITFVIFASGLKYAGLGTTALGWVLCVALAGSAMFWLVKVRPWRGGQDQDGGVVDHDLEDYEI